MFYRFRELTLQMEASFLKELLPADAIVESKRGVDVTIWSRIVHSSQIEV